MNFVFYNFIKFCFIVKISHNFSSILPIFHKKNPNSISKTRILFKNYPMDQYQLSNLPNRYQLAQHFQSSLDQPNLDNVQAKLYAIRKRNYQMAQQFFQQKYGSSVAYDQYLQQSNMADLKPPNSPFQQYEDQIDFKQHLRQKALQIQQLQMQKIQNNKQGEGKVINKRPNSSKKNPWVDNQIKKNNQIKSSYQNNQPLSAKNSLSTHKHQESRYGQHSKDYIDEEQPSMQIQVIDLKKQKQRKQQENKGQFISQFKQYLANKNRLKSAQKQAQVNGTTQSPSKLGKTMQNNSLMNKSLAKSKTFNLSNNQSNLPINTAVKNGNISNDLKKSFTSSHSNLQTTPQQQLVKKIFKTINTKSKRTFAPNSNQQYIQKIQLAQYMTQNQRILDVLNIRPQQIVFKVQNQLETKDSNKIKFHQCLMFVYQLLGKQEEQKRLRAKHCFSDTPDGCMLQPDVIKQFQKIFKILDKPCDLIVKRLQFIQRLALDPMLSKIINTPAVYQPNLNKTISLRRVFERIQVQTLLSSQQDVKANQYISWSQFMKYFESGHSDRGKYDILRLIQTLKQQQKMGFSDIPEAVYQVIIQAVKKLDKGQQYFNTHDIIGEILINKIFQVQKYTFIRGKGNDPKSGNIPMETFQQTLIRIKQTAPKFVTIKQFLQFFSVKGQPIQLIQQQLQQKIKAQNSFAKVTKVQDQIFGQNDHQVEGYDSDPQFYNNSQLIDKKQFRKTFNNNPTKDGNGSKIGGSRQFDNGSNQNLALKGGQLKITVPKPFKFQQRQKQRAQQRERLNRSASISHDRGHSEYKFKAKQIPQKVKQVGLYEKILQQNKKKIEDRKKCSVLLTLANQQPFSFYNRKAPKKTKQQRQQFKFKANPIPWFCSVDLLKKKEEQQINRNQKIARMAQQSLSKAKLPPRMEKDFQEKLARKNLQQMKKNQRPKSVIKAKEPPNFQLLHKQFQSALQRKRKQNKKTQIKQFNFSQIKRQKKVQKDELNQQQNILEQQPQQKQQKWRQTLKSSINIFASSTAKFDQQVQKRRKQRQQKKRIQQQKLRQQQQRRKINEQLNKKLKQQTQLKKQVNKNNELLQNKKKQMKQQEQSFKQRKAQWLANASKQPLLVQRPLKRDLQIQKMKKLQQISQNLKKNGIKGRQHDQYFKKDQLLLLQDYQFLVKKGQKI